MSLFLKHRRNDLTELMDLEDCDPIQLANTYRQFAIINRALSGWRKLYNTHIRPYLHQHQKATLLDVGFGGGDIPLFLSQLARNDGFELKITAIEIDERALKYVQNLKNDPNVAFQHASLQQMLDATHTFDFVISNHVLHHLSESDITDFMKKASLIATHKVLFNDLRRSDVGFVLFWIISRFFRKSFVRIDGLMSIQRSFTQKELRSVVPTGWRIEQLGFFRLLAVYPTLT